MNAVKLPLEPLDTRRVLIGGHEARTDVRFWDRLARKYAAGPIKDTDSYEAGLARTLEFFDEDDRVLEIGCGTGMTALRLAQSLGHITSTDFSPGMIEIANERLASDPRTNVSFWVADAGDRIEGAPFKGILAYNLLHLLPNLAHTLALLWDQLEPGGIFVSKSVCLEGKGWYLKPVIRLMQTFGKATYVSFLSEADLKKTITDQGFEIIEDRIMGRKRMSYFVVAQRPQNAKAANSGRCDTGGGDGSGSAK